METSLTPLKRNKFFELFPPPHFLEMHAIGLDISDEAVRFVELKRAGKGFELGVFGQKKIPPDIIEEGYIKNKVELTKILRSIQEEHGFHFVRASLPEEKTYLFRTQIPFVAEGDVRNVLKFKIEENVPVSLNDAVYDYRVVKKPQEGDATIELGVAVIHNKVVSSYLSAIEDAGLMTLSFQVESQAIVRTLIAPSDMDTCIIVAVRETKTVLAIVSQGAIQLTSTLPIGGTSIAASIKKTFSVDDAGAERIRQGKEVKASTEMFMSLVNAASVVQDEIQKLFTYWEGHMEKEGRRDQVIKRIILAGADTLLGLDQYLAQSFNIPILIANVWKNILSVDDYVPPISHRESLDYAAALGLALPYD
jgi:type IV pilus assembly protein PilM